MSHGTLSIIASCSFVATHFRLITMEYTAVIRIRHLKILKLLALHGQLYIPSVLSEMRFFTFECRVWNENVSQWSQSHRLPPLKVLIYGKPKLSICGHHNVAIFDQQ